MIFGYDELKTYVREDCVRFCDMGFDEEQILAAMLDEYEHGEDFCQAEWICIHLFLVTIYAEKGLDNAMIIEKLRQELTEWDEQAMRSELGNDYTKYIAERDLVIAEKG